MTSSVIRGDRPRQGPSARAEGTSAGGNRWAAPRTTYDRCIDDANGWDAYAADWDEDEAARAYSSAAYASLLGVLRPAGIDLDSASIIDFGCGTGLLTERLVDAGASVDAVDTSSAMLEVLDRKIARRGWTGVRTATSLPSRAAVYDVIVCSSVCSFLDDYPATVSELAARLRPGGVFVQWDWERSGDDDHGLTKDEIRSALEHAGLAEVAVEIGFDVALGDQRMAPLIGVGRRAS